MAPQILKPQYREVFVRDEGHRVLVIENGKTLIDLPWDGALALARAIAVKARKAEEVAKAEQVIFEQAILTRSGAPFGLTNTPHLLKAAANEAAWNSQLRRYIRGRAAGGIESRAIVGTPTIISHPPTKKADNGD